MTPEDYSSQKIEDLMKKIVIVDIYKLPRIKSNAQN